MKKLTLIICTLVASVSFMNAQQLGDKELTELKNSFAPDSQTQTIQNILLENKNIKALAYNPQLAPKVDNFFKYEAKVSGITDQESSGRCWMFTSMNELRPVVMKKYNIKKFDFSHNYNYFYDMLEKSNLFLENIIRLIDRPMDDREVSVFFKSPIGDGGVWNLFYNVAVKYGVVPAEVMPETEHSNNTSQMLSIIKERLRKGGYDIRALKENKKNAPKLATLMQEKKMETLKDIYRVLSLCLGVPPTEFTWRFEDKEGKMQTVKTTPKEFFNSIIDPASYNPDNYIMIMNDPTRDYYKVYEIDNYRNSVEGINWIYLNLPNEDIKAAALESLKAGEPMYASCDVGKQSNTKSGTGFLDPNLYNYDALLGIDLKMDKKARILTRQSGSSHAMLVVACDTDDNGNFTKWKFENSWGADAGRHGYLVFTDEWFNEYLFRMVINKKYLGEKAVKALNQKPIMLPVWDYMY